MRGWNTGSCSGCDKFQTGHKCQQCKGFCCNFCNTATGDDIADVVCPKCSTEVQDEFLHGSEVISLRNTENGERGIRRGRGRPRKIIPSGQILIPLTKKKRGRPCKPKEAVDDKPKKPRGRPGKASIKTNFIEESSEESDAGENVEKLREVRMLGNRNILSKVFVDEALTCSKPIEAHMFDVHLAIENPLPCYYCGEMEITKISSTLTDDKYPLCKKCKECGRGAAPRRKSRKLVPQAVKVPKQRILKAKKTRKSLI